MAEDGTITITESTGALTITAAPTRVEVVENRPILSVSAPGPATDVSGYVPYTGATASLDLGAYNATARKVLTPVSSEGSNVTIAGFNWCHVINCIQNSPTNYAEFTAIKAGAVIVMLSDASIGFKIYIAVMGAEQSFNISEMTQAFAIDAYGTVTA
jgi:hypothetical protein